jgi:hypothetical protein
MFLSVETNCFDERNASQQVSERGTTGKFQENSKSVPTHSKFSENCRKPFLSSKQSLSTDKKQFKKKSGQMETGDQRQPLGEQRGTTGNFQKNQDVPQPTPNFLKIVENHFSHQNNHLRLIKSSLCHQSCGDYLQS